ncbi:MAG: hypothetical protein D8M59_02345 [Planctomycetes bacterium]|nr:hypothetical protein [Planctomycetota bacterium]NOG54441.1 hypothetical protein [Planctomycetota bacterium]
MVEKRCTSKKRPTRERRTLCYPKDLPQPRDWLRFVHLPPFDPAFKKCGLDDEDLRALEMLVMVNPEGHPVITGTGGVRKLRFTSNRWSSGKRGGARVYYLHVAEKGIVFWLYIHMKNEQDNLTDAGKKVLRSLVEEVVDYLENG